MKQAQEWPSTNTTLLGRLREPRDELAWRRFVDVYWPLIYHFANQRGLQGADAENAAQEVLARVARAMRQFRYDPERGRFRNWLGLIVRQQLARHFAARKKRAWELQEPLVESFDERFAGDVDAAWVESFNAHVYRCAREIVASEFDPPTWRAFELVWEQGREARDAAAELASPTEWVYQAKFRVLRRMKQEVLRLSSDSAFLGRPR